MHFNFFGDRNNPALICVPGLLGGAEDFRAMLPEWSRRFFVIVPDPNQDRRELGLAHLTPESLQEVSYGSSAKNLAEVLERNGKDRAYLIGISLGGKVVYDFAARFPSMITGALITDVGLAPFERSELYRFVDDLVATLPLNLPWDELKIELKSRIPERNLRSLIQAQIHYPERRPPAVWKIGMRYFRKTLQKQGLDDQFEAYSRVDALLADTGREIQVLHAASLSGIDPESLDRMKRLRSIRIIPIPESTHFLHVTHKDLILERI